MNSKAALYATAKMETEKQQTLERLLKLERSSTTDHGMNIQMMMFVYMLLYYTMNELDKNE